MSTRLRRFFIILALAAAAFAPFAEKAEASDELDLYMVMTMAGLTAGSIKLSIDEKETQTVSKLAMKSQGFFKFLTGYKSKANARSSGDVDGKSPMPISYNSTSQTKKTERRVEIRYDGDSGKIATLDAWKRGKLRKTKVPASMQSATVDPLTAMMQFRHWIRELRGGGGVQKIAAIEAAKRSKLLDVFDGRRRYRLAIELLERQEIRHADNRVPALLFKVELQPLAGFSKNDMLANWSSEDGQRWIEVVVTDDADPIPISMATKGGTLKTSVYLRKICHGDDKCTKIKG